KSATETREVIELLTTALKNGVNKVPDKPLKKLRKIVKESLENADAVLKMLPSAITKMSPPAGKARVRIETAINNIINEPWYGEAFPSRLGEEVINQVSFASSSEESRLDIGALAYSLSAITHSDAFYLPP